MKTFIKLCRRKKKRAICIPYVILLLTTNRKIRYYIFDFLFESFLKKKLTKILFIIEHNTSVNYITIKYILYIHFI